jgi:hypothetical protein
MIKGWKNNPAWVEYYERRDIEKKTRQFNRLEMEARIKTQRLLIEGDLKKQWKFFQQQEIKP